MAACFLRLVMFPFKILGELFERLEFSHFEASFIIARNNIKNKEKGKEEK